MERLIEIPRGASVIVTRTPKVIAVDFDGCLHSGEWPNIGRENWQAIHELIRRRMDGDKVILWSCREGTMLSAAVTWCFERGLSFDSVNENLKENIEKYGGNCRKVYADEYWDDKAVPVVSGHSKVNQGPEGYVVVINSPRKRNAFLRFIDYILGKERNMYVRDVARSE